MEQQGGEEMISEKLTPRQARALAGKSQTDIANLMGVCLTTYRKYEENPETMTIAQAKQFCKVVNLSMDNISFGTESS